MLKAVSAVGRFTGGIVSLMLLAVLAIGAWWGLRAYLGLQRDREQIDTLRRELEDKDRQIARLQTALRLLKVDHRVAQIEVLSQHGSEQQKTLVTTFRFVEVDDQGNPLTEPRTFTVKGDIAYVEALVVKFADQYVEAGDPLRGTSICLFRRIFGQDQKPNEGYVLDAVGSLPAAYRSGRAISEFEREIWAQFWEYANDPVKARHKGIQAAHGEAPFQKLIPGKRYRVLLRASAGLKIEPEDGPPATGPVL
ncbi:MAG: hypothetical protein ACUVUC_01885 [Thermoguttaceae bacterium]